MVGSNADCPAIDQRGLARPFDGDGNGTTTCDIGAFEARQQIAISDVVVTEGTNITTTAIFTVSLFPTSSQTVTVDYTTAADTALTHDDFTAQSGTVTFAPGQLAQQIAIEIVGDLVDEPDETFFLSLSNPINADLIDAQAVGTIIDDDGDSALTVNDVTVNESDSSQTIAYVTVMLSPVATEVVTMSYRTRDGTAQADTDFEAANGELIFAAGEISKTVEVTVAGDNVDEGVSENFTFQLIKATNATLTNSEALITILDNDAARVSIRPGPSIAEGNSGTHTATFTLTLRLPAAFTVSVEYTTVVDVVNNPATPNEDYEPQTGSRIFQPGETVKTVGITVIGDTIAEADEHFSLRLSNANPVPLAANVSTGFILNDDEAQSLLYLPTVFSP